MNETQFKTTHRTAILHTLAVVGFVALVGASMLLAVYSTRFVPNIAGRLGSAAVFLGSVFTPSSEPSLTVVPTSIASTTISFADASSSVSSIAPSSVSTIPKVATATPAKSTPTQGPKTTSTIQIGGSAPIAAAPQTGLPDFVVTIDAIGYLATTSTDSFVASLNVPVGNRPAVKFTIKNVGGNDGSPWRFSASIPTQTAYIYQSQPQQPLASGDSIAYVLGFDQATKGPGQLISISANFDRAVPESNPNNNSASAAITVLAS
jgi:hypothetical protein